MDAGGQGVNFTNTGTLNTFTGYTAGFGNTTGSQNSCYGAAACLHNLGGSQNTALGVGAGFRNDTGSHNTYVGFDSGWTNSGNINNNTFSGWESGFANSGSNNVFSGYQAGSNNTANGNSFFGFSAGTANTSGNSNTFLGNMAGTANTTGSSNTFVGDSAGESLQGGDRNTSIGARSGFDSYNGSDDNTLVGYLAGQFAGSENTDIGSAAGGAEPGGDSNTYVGYFAGGNNSGSYNIFVGWEAGIEDENISSSNIYIGNQGCGGVCTESNTIRIGSAGIGDGQQYQVFMGPILLSTIAATNSPVCIDANGALGTAATCNPGSSRRFKDQIADMGDSSSKLFQLRPVSFFYKPQYDDGTRAQQYGLIAEEVAKVYPEMAVYDKDGQPSGVKYQLLAPMLLNELQKEHAVVMSQQDELQTQLQQIKAQRQEIDSLKHELQLQNASLHLKNASLEERLTRLESYLETQMKTASDVQPATIASSSGGLQ